MLFELSREELNGIHYITNENKWLSLLVFLSHLKMITECRRHETAINTKPQATLLQFVPIAKFKQSTDGSLHDS